MTSIFFNCDHRRHWRSHFYGNSGITLSVDISCSCIVHRCITFHYSTSNRSSNWCPGQGLFTIIWTNTLHLQLYNTDIFTRTILNKLTKCTFDFLNLEIRLNRYYPFAALSHPLLSHLSHVLKSHTLFGQRLNEPTLERFPCCSATYTV